jgi:hypothetical protein
MANEVIISEHLKGGPAAIFRQQRMEGEEFEDLSEGIGTGYSVIGLEGKGFYLKHRGTRHTITNPPDGSTHSGKPAQYFDMIILRKNSLPSHTWYEKGYVAGSKEPPDCVSTDGVAPDDSSRKKQSDFCQTCKLYAWQDLPNGRRGRICTDSMRLAVLPLPYLIQNVLNGTTINEPCLFRVPAASMQGLARLGEELQKRGLCEQPGDAPLCSFVCRLGFQEQEKYPKLTYEVLDWLDDGQAAAIMELRKHPTTFRIMGQSPEGRSIVRMGANQPGVLRQQIAEAPPGRPQIVPTQQQKYLELTPESVVENIVTSKPVQAPTPVPQPAPAPAPAPASVPKPQLASVPDTDSQIDALIEAMRPRPPGG